MRFGEVDPPPDAGSEPQQRWQEVAGSYGEPDGGGMQTGRSTRVGEDRAGRGRYALALRSGRPLWSPGGSPRWRGGALRRKP